MLYSTPHSACGPVRLHLWGLGCSDWRIARARGWHALALNRTHSLDHDDDDGVVIVVPQGGLFERSDERRLTASPVAGISLGRTLLRTARWTGYGGTEMGFRLTNDNSGFDLTRCLEYIVISGEGVVGREEGRRTTGRKGEGEDEGEEMETGGAIYLGISQPPSKVQCGAGTAKDGPATVPPHSSISRRLVGQAEVQNSSQPTSQPARQSAGSNIECRVMKAMAQLWRRLAGKRTK